MDQSSSSQQTQQKQSIHKQNQQQIMESINIHKHQLFLNKIVYIKLSYAQNCYVGMYNLQITPTNLIFRENETPKTEMEEQNKSETNPKNRQLTLNYQNIISVAKSQGSKNNPTQIQKELSIIMFLSKPQKNQFQQVGFENGNEINYNDIEICQEYNEEQWQQNDTGQEQQKTIEMLKSKQNTKNIQLKGSFTLEISLKQNNLPTFKIPQTSLQKLQQQTRNIQANNLLLCQLNQIYNAIINQINLLETQNNNTNSNAAIHQLLQLGTEDQEEQEEYDEDDFQQKNV